MTWEETLKLIEEEKAKFSIVYKRLNKQNPPQEPLRTQHLNDLFDSANEIKRLIASEYSNLTAEKSLANEIHFGIRDRTVRLLERLRIKIALPIYLNQPFVLETERDPESEVESIEPESEEGEMADPLAFANFVARVVPPFDGEPESLQAFEDALSLVALKTNDTNVEEAVLIIKSKLKGTARSFITNEATVAGILNTLRANIKCESSVAALAKLESVKGTTKTCDYLKDLENLCGALKRAYIAEGVSAQLAEKYTAQNAQKVLANKALTDQVKTIIKAGQFSEVSEVLSKYAQVAPAEQAAVLKFNKHKSSKYQNGRNGNGRNGYRNNGNNWNNNNNWNRRNNWQNNNGGSQNNQNPNQNGRNSNNNNRNNRGNNRNVRYTDQENGEGPRENHRNGGASSQPGPSHLL